MHQALAERTSPPRGSADARVEDLRAQGCGLVLGRYTLLRKIAAGGMAEIFIAMAPGVSGFARKVAIKKILPQFSHNENFVAMLLDEAKISVSLTHPNIAQVYELGVDAHGSYFIVMEYVDGRPLHRLLQRVLERTDSPLPVTHAAHIIGEVAKGLDHAHRQKDQNGSSLSIVHRDVSPQNVLISHEGSVKLIDFGIARAEGRLGQTGHGIIKGKLRYLAPEIAGGKEPDLRADIYCAGIVLFELLTGEPMFAPKNDLSALEMAKAARVRSPRSINPAVPEELDAIVMRALKKDREERYQSAKDLYSDLRMFLNRHAPLFNESELGETMQAYFQPEIEDARELDSLAQIMACGPSPKGFTEEPTVAVDEWDMFLKEQLAPAQKFKGEADVPRGKVHLQSADGGRPMSIVLASGVAPAYVRGSGAGKGDPLPAGTKIKPPPAPAGTLARGKSGLLRETLREESESIELDDGDVTSDDDKTASPIRVAQRHEEEEYEAEDEDLDVAETPEVDMLEAHSEIAKALAQPLPAVIVQVPTATIELPSAPENEAKVTELPRVVDVQAESAGKVTAMERALPQTLAPLALPKAVAKKSTTLGMRLLFSFSAACALATVMSVWSFVRSEEPVAIAAVPSTALAAAIQTPAPVQQAEPAVLSAADQVDNDEREVAAEEADAPVVESEEDAHRAVVAPVSTGSLFVNSRPVSTVWIDGKKKGRTPLQLQLRPGKHEITLESPEGETETRIRKVTAGKNTPVIVRWKK